MTDTIARLSPPFLPAVSSIGSLCKFLIEILLQSDIPSLTRFSYLNRRAMQLVSSIFQYTVIVSIQADAFDCATLYGTLCTTQCSTCNRQSDYLYLIDFRRVLLLLFHRASRVLPPHKSRSIQAFHLQCRATEQSSKFPQTLQPGKSTKHPEPA